jgi:deoxyribonuclease-4
MTGLPLLGLHVSPAGGLPKAVERGVERGCESIQIFTQSPRRWAPTNHSEESSAEFRASPIQSVVIHALYLSNAATPDPELREKSLTAITHSLRVGDAIGAAGVVLHPGSAKDGHVGEAIARCGDVFQEALAESESCPLLLEDTAGAGGTLGRSFEELAALLEVSGGHERIGFCLDSCHLLASGYDVRTAEALDGVLADADAQFGLERLRCIHVNDSQTPTATPRSARARSARSASRPSSPSRASRACRSSSRAPASRARSPCRPTWRSCGACATRGAPPAASRESRRTDLRPPHEDFTETDHLA